MKKEKKEKKNRTNNSNREIDDNNIGVYALFMGKKPGLFPFFFLTTERVLLVKKLIKKRIKLFSLQLHQFTP